MDHLRRTVFERDRWLCLARVRDATHRCRNRWGEEVEPREGVTYVNALTLEHVRLEPGGKRRDDERFCVTLCHGANAEEHWGSTTDHRAWLNAYLDALYPGRKPG
jgi:hypothetical protein